MAHIWGLGNLGCMGLALSPLPSGAQEGRSSFRALCQSSGDLHRDCLLPLPSFLQVLASRTPYTYLLHRNPHPWVHLTGNQLWQKYDDHFADEKTEPWEKNHLPELRKPSTGDTKTQTPNLLASSSLLFFTLQVLSLLRLRPSSYFPQRQPQIPFLILTLSPSALFGIWLWSQLGTFLNHHLWLHNHCAVI